jgi:hypothetical protein
VPDRGAQGQEDVAPPRGQALRANLTRARAPERKLAPSTTQ